MMLLLAHYAEHIKTILDRWMLPCILHSMTGLYCPGCGGTRAVFLLLSGHPLKSFFYHPIVLYTAVLYGWYMISTTVDYITKEKYGLAMRYHNGYLWAALVLVVLNGIIKNAALLLFHVQLIP